MRRLLHASRRSSSDAPLVDEVPDQQLKRNAPGRKMKPACSSPVGELGVYMEVSQRIGVVSAGRIAEVLPPDEPGLARLVRLKPVAVGLGLAVLVDDLYDLAHE